MTKDSGKTIQKLSNAVGTKKSPKNTDQKSSRPFAEVDAYVREVLLELMAHSESDSVRVAAAKALMDKIKKGEEAEHGKRQDEEKHADAVQEAEDLLEEIAREKSGGADCADKMD